MSRNSSWINKGKKKDSNDQRSNILDVPDNYHFHNRLKSYFNSFKGSEIKLALIMLNIEGLSYINYALGYEKGHQVICEVLHRVRKIIGKDTYISRNSDHHFSIIIKGEKTRNAYEHIAKDLINSFKAPFKIHPYELGLWVNVGICIYDEMGQEEDLFSKHAKMALLGAMKEGRNTYQFYSSKLNKENLREMSLRSDLRHVIEKEQLRLHYQPIVHLRTNKILAAEALLRWEHPKWGLIYPNDFIALSEETGCIIDMSKWVLREVFKNYRHWKNALPDLEISVNFSGVQFQEPDLVEDIEKIIDEFKLDPSFLIIEITENVWLKDSERIKSHISKLRSLGIKVAMDDYGRGFSSLYYLSCLNIDILKIDRCFIKNISNDANGVIIKNTINMAKELKIKLVAEGIEEREQLTTLQESNCYAGQGYIYSKPMDATDFERMLLKKKCKPSE